jgi:hypothetical protein
MIQLFFRKTQDGKTIVIDCDLTDTILQVKELIYQKTDVPVDYIRINKTGKVLHDGPTLEEYGIEPLETLQLTFRPIQMRF